MSVNRKVCIWAARYKINESHLNDCKKMAVHAYGRSPKKFKLPLSFIRLWFEDLVCGEWRCNCACP